ncbi:MAG: NAD-dependent deacylase [Bacteroides sp.]|nr:NAD-dependent deacylase [Bacteroides sp.]MCM1379158.1 NAD-dependent deacylase [Bacteroides sp.]MCM1445193.1 NAD-dependent deacylase [Prevotella sp.]
MKRKLVFLTGAGVSAESGIRTFRDADGLWEQYPVMDVCSATGFRRNPALVHQFYNERRKQLGDVEPNAAHIAIAQLAEKYDVKVVTQNVDNLHERAGTPSDDIIHLHGELMKVRALDDDSLVYELCPPNIETTPQTLINGHYVRPHIVFFEEAVPMIEPAVEVVAQADILVIVGTSLNVYPAAGLINYARPDARIFYIDPNPAAVSSRVRVIAQPATKGLQTLIPLLAE